MVLGRDRLGVKPLYYHREATGRLLFASEIKALFVDPAVPRTLNSPRLAEYLTYRSIAGEETLFADIFEQEPGTLMVLEGNRLVKRRYWTPEVSIAAAGGPAAVETGRRLLADAVEVRLVSDVPLGTITSGGLDSSLVSVVAAAAAGRSIDTFCVGFADTSYDERPFARTVAGKIGARHHEIEVMPDAIERELDRLTWAHDEPLSPSCCLARAPTKCSAVTSGIPWCTAASGCAVCRCWAPWATSCPDGREQSFGKCSIPTICWRRTPRSRRPRSGRLASTAPTRSPGGGRSGRNRLGM
jgi:asparagine synthase (glutamine-hydrolysing)